MVDQPWTLPLPSVATIGSLIGIAGLSTAFAYILYFRILSTAGATNLLLVTFLVPVSAVLLGVLVLNEAFLARPLHRDGYHRYWFGRPRRAPLESTQTGGVDLKYPLPCLLGGVILFAAVVGHTLVATGVLRGLNRR